MALNCSSLSLNQYITCIISILEKNKKRLLRHATFDYSKIHMGIAKIVAGDMAIS